jgi:hypothetical protein
LAELKGTEERSKHNEHKEIIENEKRNANEIELEMKAQQNTEIGTEKLVKMKRDQKSK